MNDFFQYNLLICSPKAQTMVPLSWLKVF